jgi:hypothetical protein
MRTGARRRPLSAEPAEDGAKIDGEWSRHLGRVPDQRVPMRHIPGLANAGNEHLPVGQIHQPHLTDPQREIRVALEVAVVDPRTHESSIRDMLV